MQKRIRRSAQAIALLCLITTPFLIYKAAHNQVLASATALGLQTVDTDARCVDLGLSLTHGVILEFRLTQMNDSTPVSDRATWFLFARTNCRVVHHLQGNSVSMPNWFNP